MINSLPECKREAYQEYVKAMYSLDDSRSSKLPTLKELWTWAKGHSDDTVDFPTWSRYVRDAKRALKDASDKKPR